MASGPDTGAMTLTWKQRVMRGEPYNPSKLSPEEERELHGEEMVTCRRACTSLSKPWNVQTAINKEKQLREIQISTEMLERNKEK